MKISAIQQKLYYLKSSPKRIAKTGNELSYEKRLCLPSVYYPCSTILGIANAGKLKQLFSYGLPCMYSGIEMIDPKKVQKFLKNKSFEAKLPEVLSKIKDYENSLQGVEAEVYEVLKERANITPEFTVQETFRDISPYYQSTLRKKQAPVFQKLIALGKELPEGYRYNFIQLMHETRDKLADKPVIVPFSTFEFRYKLKKIKEDVTKIKSVKANRVMIKLQTEAEKLPEETSNRTNAKQKEIIHFLETIIKTSVLKNNKSLQELINNAKARLNDEKVLIPFSRKSFIYDLSKLLENLPDKQLKSQMLGLVEYLPTSRESVPAYILKFASEPSEKIVYRLLWPSLASIEHIFPRSNGGIDDISNFGGACTRENSDRKSIDFVEQIKRKPETSINCQKYIDKLIDLAKAGVFEENNIDIKYIEEFKNTVFEESQGQILLDISRLYE